MILVEDALVLRRVRFANTSQIGSLLGAASGRIEVLVRGARRERHGFQHGLDLLTRGQAVVYPRRASLDLLAEWDPADTFPRLRRRLDSIHAAWIAGEVALELLPGHDPGGKLFRLLRTSLELLDGGADPANLLWIFWAAALRDAGVYPQLERCTTCHRPPARPYLLAPDASGLLCASCRRRSGPGTFLSPGTVRSLVHLSGTGDTVPSNLRVSAETGRELLRAFAEVQRVYTGRPLRTLGYARELIAASGSRRELAGVL